MDDWPSTYVPGDPGGQLGRPSLSKQAALLVGDALAKALIRDEPIPLDPPLDPPLTFARAYLMLVKLFYRKRSDQLLGYTSLIKIAASTLAPVPDLSAFNAHDFANVHRVAWLTIVRGLSRLVGFNPFYNPDMNPKNQWADPAAGTTSRGAELRTRRADFLFEIPNPSGYYAVASRDFDTVEGTVFDPPPPPDPILNRFA
ncbi:MAG: hypothetical protein QOI11_876 [Candidatus Eremiobacteraeota bacterium]|jgi:hypothetical protein|nr:hypothetical protein [Candidatus Eremiobacteraeota bacterium]